MPRVSIIIVNYNGKDIVRDCLRSIEAQTFKDFEVILIDNGSSDGSPDEIKRFLEEKELSSVVKFIPLDVNTGFAGGNIEGLKYCSGEYIALLNNDAVAEDKWLEELVKAMDSHPEVGICASKMIDYGSGNIDSAGDIFSTFLKGFKRGEGEDAGKYNTGEYVFGACAGAALYRRKMIDEIGFLDSDFFLIQEDTDLNFRAQLAGWKVLYVPAAVAYHKVRSSIGHMSDTAVYYTLRNTELVRIKNVPFLIFLKCLPWFLIWTVMEFIYFVVRHGQLRLYFKAKTDVVRMLPVMLKKRAVVMRNRKAPSDYLTGMMTSLLRGDQVKAKVKKLFYG